MHLRKLVRNLAIAFSVATLIGPSTGCYGPFKLTKKLHAWNGSLGDKFINALVFFAFIVIPVYQLATLGDALIFNTIEFWGGSNPITLKEGEVREKLVMVDGQPARIVMTGGKGMRIERGADSLELRTTPGGMVLLDGRGHEVARAQALSAGDILITDARGTREIPAEDAQRMADSLQRPADFLAAREAATGQRVAAAR